MSNLKYRIKNVKLATILVFLLLAFFNVQHVQAEGAGCCEVQCPVAGEEPIVGCVTLHGGNPSQVYGTAGAGEVLSRDCVADSLYLEEGGRAGCDNPTAIPHPDQNCTSTPTCPEYSGGPPAGGEAEGATESEAGAGTAGGTSGGAISLPNPLGTDNIYIIVGRIIRMLMGAIGMIALLMFIYGGFQWLTAAGNPEKIKKGQQILLWVTLGMAIMFTAYFTVRYILVALVQGTGVRGIL